MARNPRRIDARLRELYAQVPDIPDCKGLCHDSCGPIECSVRERQVVEERAGRPLRAEPVSCSLLSPTGLCTVYDDRPMICRLWGTSRKMRCEHGCTPSRWLTDDEFFELLVASFEAGDPPPGLRIDRVRKFIESENAGSQVANIALAMTLVQSAQQGQALPDAAVEVFNKLGLTPPDSSPE